MALRVIEVWNSHTLLFGSCDTFPCRHSEVSRSPEVEIFVASTCDDLSTLNLAISYSRYTRPFDNFLKSFSSE